MNSAESSDAARLGDGQSGRQEDVKFVHRPFNSLTPLFGRSASRLERSARGAHCCGGGCGDGGALDPASRGLRWLKVCGVAGIAVMVVLQFALLIRSLYLPELYQSR